MEGTVRAAAEGHVLRFERHLKHPVAKVWAAITQPERLVQWLAEVEADLVLGGQIRLHWLNTNGQDGRVYCGTITAIDPPRLLEYEAEVHGRLRWELEPEESGCRLIFTCILSGPKQKVADHLAGWHIHMDHLVDALAGQPVDWPRWWPDYGARWEEYRDRYLAGLTQAD